ncbi:MAG: hypothetical protein QXU18_08975 [Thermoplasmatales archaeon]
MPLIIIVSMAYRDTASFGKRQEYTAIAEMLKRGFDVYMTLVDDQGIDCVIRRECNGNPDYLDIQIKARSKECKPNDAARFAAMNIPNPRSNLWFIFYSEQLDKYWIINSMELTSKGKANQNKSGKNAGKWHINLAGYSKSGVVTASKRFSKYEDEAGFKQLECVNVPHD